MDDYTERRRITWTTRINVKPTCRDLLRAMAHDEHLSMATMIGVAIETYVTERSTA
jgi:hypothetical protein